MLNGLQRGIHAASVFLSAAARRVQRTSASAPDLLMPGHQVTAREHLVKPSGAAGSEGESPDLQLKRLDSGSWNGDLSCSKSLSQSDSLARVSSTGNAAGGPPPCSLQSAARGSPGEAVGVAGGAAGGARVTASVHGVSSDTVEKVCTILSCVPCCVLLLLRRSALDAHAQTARAHVAATRCCTAPSTGDVAPKRWRPGRRSRGWLRLYASSQRKGLPRSVGQPRWHRRQWAADAHMLV